MAFQYFHHVVWLCSVFTTSLVEVSTGRQREYVLSEVVNSLRRKTRACGVPKNQLTYGAVRATELPVLSANTASKLAIKHQSQLTNRIVFCLVLIKNTFKQNTNKYPTFTNPLSHNKHDEVPYLQIFYGTGCVSRRRAPEPWSDPGKKILSFMTCGDPIIPSIH